VSVRLSVTSRRFDETTDRIDLSYTVSFRYLYRCEITGQRSAAVVASVVAWSTSPPSVSRDWLNPPPSSSKLSTICPEHWTTSSTTDASSKSVNRRLLLASNTHTPSPRLTALFPGSTQVSRYQKGKTNLDFTEARDSEWQWHQLGHMQVCTAIQADNNTSTPALK